LPAVTTLFPATFALSFQMRSRKDELRVELPATVLDWLRAKATEHQLPDEGKAFRCCLMYAVAQGPLGSLPPSAPASVPNVTIALPLAPQQLGWIDEQVVRLGEEVTASRVVSAVCDACLRADSEQVFGVVRCKTGATVSDDATCEGARQALARQRARREASTHV
jgi:hypothetical protein